MLRNFFYVSVVLTAIALLLWFFWPARPDVSMRVPIPGNQVQLASEADESSSGVLIPGPGLPSADQGSWPQFRGADRTNISTGTKIPESWTEKPPKILWRIQVGEGYAGASIHRGRVYLLDYDEVKKADAIRCLSLTDGQEIWRYTYPVKVKRNHGMSRTVPAVNDQYVVALGPKCNLHCLNAETGQLVWRKHLVTEYDTKIPEWYAGQCPLIEQDRVIIAPGGKRMMTALELATAKAIWEASGEETWQMTHASIMPLMFEGKKQYTWCASGGAVGVDAETGKILWKFPGWTIKIATITSPLDLGEGKILFSGGYNSGALMAQLVRKDDGIQVETLFKTEAKVFGAEQHTPILCNGLIYAIIPGGKLACLSPEGKRLWVGSENFGLGPFMMIDDKLLALDDDQENPGELCMFKISATGAQKLGGFKVIEGHEAWAPMAFADGKLVLRDFTTITCLDLNGN